MCVTVRVLLFRWCFRVHMWYHGSRMLLDGLHVCLQHKAVLAVKASWYDIMTSSLCYKGINCRAAAVMQRPGDLPRHLCACVVTTWCFSFCLFL
jgi:hypothetical protein